MATHSRILAWRIPWTRSLAGHSPLGRTSRTRLKRLGTGQHRKCGPCFSKAWRLDRTLRTHRIWPWPSILILRTPRKGPAWEGRTAPRGTSFGLMHLAEVSTERGGQVGGESFSRGEDCGGQSYWRGQSLSHGVPEWQTFLERQSEPKTLDVKLEDRRSLPGSSCLPSRLRADLSDTSADHDISPCLSRQPG